MIQTILIINISSECDARRSFSGNLEHKACTRTESDEHTGGSLHTLSHIPGFISVS
jgi:hypothetical protein